MYGVTVEESACSTKKFGSARNLSDFFVFKSMYVTW